MPTMSAFDYSNLPDVIWANVLAQVSLHDRLSVARTCQRLNEIFNHPSVWQTVRIVLLKNLQRPGSPSTEQYESMIRSFGSYFYDLTLIIHGDVCQMGEPCQKVLSLLAEYCNPIKFSIYVGNGRVAPVKPNYQDFAAIKDVISNSSRLRSLNIASWPLHHSNVSAGFNVFDYLLAGDTVDRLQHLKLFSSSPKDGDWLPLNVCIPSPDQFAQALKKFKSLRSVSLNSFMLNNAVLEMLSRPGRLATVKRLGMLIQYSTGRFSRLADTVWKAFGSSNPEVDVDVTFSNAAPSYEIISLLKPEVPLRSLTFLKYARYDADALIHVSSNHYTMLKAFHDYDPERCFEKELVEMVTRCSNLESLVFRGCLSRHAIITLASLRGDKWTRFDVSLDVYSNGDFGDDVLVQTIDGQYAIVDHLPSRFYYTDESNKQIAETIQELSMEVSKLIGQKWKPSNATALLTSSGL